jgi:putative nucleotidyltransferase with HDIG domain
MSANSFDPQNYIDAPIIDLKLREFEVFESITRTLRDAHNSDEIAQRLVFETIRLMRSQHAIVLLLEPDGTLTARASHGMYDSNQMTAPQGSLAWHVLRSGKVICENKALEAEPRCSLIPKNAAPHAHLAAPIFDSSGEAIGVVISARELPDTYSNFDERLIAVIADTTAMALERVANANELRNEIHERQTLLELTQLLARNDKEVMQEALDKIRDLSETDLVIIGTLEGDTYRLRAHSGALDTPEMQTLLENGITPHRLAELQVPSNGSGLEIAHILERPEELRTLQTAGVQAAYITRIELESVRSGMSAFRFNNPNGWTATQHRLLEAGTHTIGALLARHEQLRSLEDTYEGALRAIGLALEARDRETAGHTDRVANLSEQLAQTLEFNDTQLRALRWGAYLHDIGKLGVPDAILLKPGALTSEERLTMQQHSQLGYSLTQNLPFLPEATRNIVLHHHERWDGHGYPHGLATNNIPLEARIFAVCDVFDALTSERPYKQALSVENALAELRLSARNGHLDIKLVGILEHLIGENQRVKN